MLRYRKVVWEIWGDFFKLYFFHTFHMSLNMHFPVYTFIIVSIPCYILLYLTSIPMPNADRFGFSIRSETYACSDVALQVLLLDIVLSTLLPNTYQNSTGGTRKCHIPERFLLTVRRSTWNPLRVRAVF
jgi:hypothetical protein